MYKTILYLHVFIIAPLAAFLPQSGSAGSTIDVLKEIPADTCDEIFESDSPNWPSAASQYKVKTGSNFLDLNCCYPVFKSSQELRIAFDDMNAIDQKPAQLFRNGDNAIMAYLLRAQEAYKLGKDEMALQNFVEAEKLLPLARDMEQILAVRFSISEMRGLWGNSRENLKYIQETIEMIKGIEDVNYKERNLGVAYGILSRAYSKNKDFNSAKVYLGLARVYCSKGAESTNAEVLKIIEANIYYGEKDFDKAIAILENVGFEGISNTNLLSHHLMLGIMLADRGRESRAVKLFKMADSIFESSHIVLPDSPDMYRSLIQLYGSQRDYNGQMKTAKKLCFVSRIVNRRFRNYETALNPKNFSEGHYLFADANPLAENGSKGHWPLLAIGSLATSVCLLCIFVGRKDYGNYAWMPSKHYFYPFKNLNANPEKMMVADKVEIMNETNVRNMGISESKIQEIMDKLELFEKNLSFIKFHKLKEVSDHLNTNTSYLSKIINDKKESSFTTYMNELKINYAISSLPMEKSIHSYTISAISAEYGFSNPEKFSKLFKEKMGVYPKEYLRVLRKKRKSNT